MTKHVVPPIYTRAAADVAEMTRTERRRDGVRITRGAYVSRAVPLTPANMVAAALAVLPASALASHRTAAVLFGAPVDFAPRLEFALPPDVYRARRRGIRMHVRDLTAADRTFLDGTPITSGAQTWLDLAAVLPPDELVAVGDSLYRGEHLDAESVSERLDRAGGIRGVARARALAPMLTPQASSRPESLTRFWLIDSGLPSPVPQVPIHDRWGREVAHGDLGYPEWRVVIEYEGLQHADPRQFGMDIDRYSLMAADGWLVLRLAHRHLRRSVVVDRVGRALWSRGARW